MSGAGAPNEVLSPAEVTVRGRVVKSGCVQGEALVSTAAIGFLGGVDPETGRVTEIGHPIEGTCVAGRVLVFPTGKGSTVGSYTLYRMARNGVAPAAIINAEADPVVAVGAIISDIAMVDHIDLSLLRTGDWVRVDDGEVTINRSGQKESPVRNSLSALN